MSKIECSVDLDGLEDCLCRFDALFGLAETDDPICTIGQGIVKEAWNHMEEAEVRKATAEERGEKDASNHKKGSV